MDTQNAMKARQVALAKRLPRSVFKERQILQDINGNRYAFPQSGDYLYTPRAEPELNEHGGFGMGTVQMYAQMKGREFPLGPVHLRDIKTQKYYTGVISTSSFEGRFKSGFVVIEHLTQFGELTNPSDFLQK